MDRHADRLATLRADHAVRLAHKHALERAYPHLKEAAELLELEEIEPQARTAIRLRQEIGAMLADLGVDTREFRDGS